MTAPAPEFSRPVRADQLARHAQGVTISAEPAEREALARRFNLLSLDRLEAEYGLTEEAGGILARGHVRAELTQPCVATGLPVPESIDTDFLLRFVAESGTGEEGEELEIDSDDCDVIGFDGQVIDMGEAVAETMALAMTPYPRSPDADAYLRDAGVLTEEQASPFAALLSLQNKKK
ncbi:hypothetical protein L288_12630 [Sphingobium quisquiliarum P25]|uniref:Uncharacterized protein n=1 Tax=Sphingobium quisquiliarum P25 TaxID=1329909 RepID=T0I1E5_9SPHN|nr:YceD family protein [Sphingobium quisquiliarum]EQB05485.1 hypothetical protein L288_12630 [Sphingobium quisquiliarum P25]EZP71934.1 Chitinase [Sphingomonas paucimobilis]